MTLRLLHLLPERIASPLSMANLAREVEAAHTTVKSWLDQLKRLYVLFSVDPWTPKISRGLRREKKWYFLDWYYTPEGPARLENIVATYLYRTCLCLSDMGYGHYALYYIRTLDKKEIDFLVTREHRPVMAVEVKSGDMHLANSLKNRAKWFPDSPTLGIQVVDKTGVLQKLPENTWIMSMGRFLSLLD
jgi:predicted AAA+ superfamily ATPase